MLDEVISFYSFLGLNFELTAALSTLQVVLIIFVVAFIGYFVTKNYIVKQLRKTLFSKKDNAFSTVFLQYKPFDNVAHLASAIIIYSLADLMETSDSSITWINESVEWLEDGGIVYATLAIIWFLLSLLSVSNSYYERIKKSHQPSIKGYIQLVKIIITATAVILIVSMLLDKSPMAFLTGLGAASAIIILVFKDTILGFVAGIQIAANRMVNTGDWVELPKYGADGDVQEINLATVKVKNWDLTITTIPTYAFVSDSFKNWRGMTEGQGRRIKRAVYINKNSIKHIDAELLKKLQSVHLLKEFLGKKSEEIAAHNRAMGADDNPANGRRLTNIGVFRYYLEFYLRKNENIHKEMTLMVRQLDPTPNGLPIEIYAFSKDKKWENYESIMADIFDHIFAIAPLFELSFFQNPSGADFNALLNK